MLCYAKSLQSCPTLCNPIDSSPPGCPVPGILQARTLEWAAVSFSNAWKWKVKVKSLSRVRLVAIPWTAADLAPPSMGFSRQEYWSGVPLPSFSRLVEILNRGLFTDELDTRHSFLSFLNLCCQNILMVWRLFKSGHTWKWMWWWLLLDPLCWLQ